MKNLLIVSVIIPCRNEVKYIQKCLNSIISQDYPIENLEILIVDGISEDGTREILQEYAKKYSYIRVLDNPAKFTPFAMNIGIKNAKGDYVVRMDAHADYPKDYISKCIKYSQDYKTDNLGGLIKTISSNNTLTAQTIAISLFHPFGQGGSYFRTGSGGPKWVDTVFCGCYKKDIFKKIGLFNENLKRSQDMEFNLRLKMAGGKILLMPDIISHYYPKSNFKDFFWHKFNDGIWPIYQFKFTKKPYRLRHYLPFLFVSGLIASLILGIFYPIFLALFFFIFGTYLLVSIYFSFEIAIQKKEWRYLFLMPVAFFIRHFANGIGSIFGLLKLFSI